MTGRLAATNQMSLWSFQVIGKKLMCFFFFWCVCMFRKTWRRHILHNPNCPSKSKMLPCFWKTICPQLRSKWLHKQTIFFWKHTHNHKFKIHTSSHERQTKKKKGKHTPFIPAKSNLVFRMPLWKTNPTTLQESRGEKTRTKPKPQQNWTIRQLTKNGKENSRWHTKYQLSCLRHP